MDVHQWLVVYISPRAAEKQGERPLTFGTRIERSGFVQGRPMVGRPFGFDSRLRVCQNPPMTKRAYMVIFYSKGPLKANLCQICRKAIALEGAGLYEGPVWAESPDDAMHKISENYRGVRVRHCYPVDGDSDNWSFR